MPGWPLAGPGNVDLGRIPTLHRSGKNDSWGLKRLYTLWFILNTCFSPGSLDFWYMVGKCLHDQPLKKPSGTEPQKNFPSGQHFTHAVRACCWAIKRVLRDCTGRGLLEACFSRLRLGLLFPLLISLCTPSLWLSSESPPRESLNLWWPWGPQPTDLLLIPSDNS